MESAMAARDRSDQKPLVFARAQRGENRIARLQQLGCRICADPVTNVMAMEKVYARNGLTGTF